MELVKRVNYLDIIIWLYPLWWILGLGQILIIVFGLIGLFVFLFRGRPSVSGTEVIFLSFVIVALASSFFVSSPSRLFEVARNILVFFVVLFGSNYIRKNLKRSQIYQYLILLLFWGAIIALLSFLLKEKISFNAPIAMIIPESLKDFSLVKNLYSKNTGAYYFSLIGNFWRTKSLYSYPTSFAITSVLLLSSTYYYIFKIKKSFNLKILYWITVILVIATTTRIAIFSLLIIFGFILILEKKVVIIIFMFLAMFIFMVTSGELINTGIEVFNNIRGSGSNSFRVSLYTETFDHFLKKPIFGWGAQVPHKGFYAALGSHSTYLNTLLCYGIIGSLLFYSFNLWNLFSSLLKNKYLFMTWTVFFIVTITEVYHLDLITVLVYTFIISLTSSMEYTDNEQKNYTNEIDSKKLQTLS